MDYFPAFFNLRDKPCLIVGGGEVAARKARLLLEAGARLTVVAPHLGTTIAAYVAAGRMQHVARGFEPADVAGHWLVIAASNDVAAQRAVFVAAESAGIFCNSVDDIDNCSFITPAIVDRSPLVIAISSAGAAPVLVRQLRARIETMLPASIGRLAEFARGWRERIRRRIAHAQQRRRFWEWFFDGPVAAAIHVRQEARANDVVARRLESSSWDDSLPSGVSLVGAGPGDPGLLTLRAMQVLQTADVIVHDRLVSAEVLALARRDAERISVGKIPGCSKNTQDEINALLVRLASAGKRVCRLKGGDPYVFGRGGEEAAALVAANIPFEVIPGITAAAGCAAAAGIPLTHRDLSQSVVLITAHGKDSIDRLDWESLARDRQTLAVYMAVRRFPELMQNLVANGRTADTPVAIVEKGTTAEQRVIRGRLGQLPMLAAAHDVVSPAMLFIGEVATLALSSRAVGEFAPELPESAIQQTARL